MRVIAIAALYFLVTAAGQSLAQSEEQVFKKITNEQLASILTGDGRNAEVVQDEEGGYVLYDMKEPWRPGARGVAHGIQCDEGGCLGFHLHIGFAEVPGAKLAKINEINGRYWYGHAYLADNGSVFVMRDVFVPRITESGINGNVRVFDQVSAAIFGEFN